MALAVATLVPPGDAATPIAEGDVWAQYYTLTFSGSYTVGGELWDPLPSFGGLASAVFWVSLPQAAGNPLEYDKVNKKVKVFTAANTEMTAVGYNAAVTGDLNLLAKVVAK